MTAVDSATYVPASNMKMLRHAVKTAHAGTGEVAQAIKSCNFEITERGFTMLIGTCQRSGRCRKAMEIFKAMTGPEMVARGIRPNFYTYSSLISVCCYAGACGKALEVFQAMRQACQPLGCTQADGELYRRLLVACYRDGRMADVKYLYECMIEQGLSADKDMTVCVVEAYASLKQWDSVGDLLDKVHQCEMCLPYELYTRILEICGDSGEVDCAVEFFLTMQMAGVNPTSVDCHHVLRAAVAGRDLNACMNMLQEMENSGIAVSRATQVHLYPRIREQQEAKLQEATVENPQCLEQQSYPMHRWASQDNPRYNDEKERRASALPSGNNWKDMHHVHLVTA